MLKKDLIDLAKEFISTKDLKQLRYESQILISNILNRSLLKFSAILNTKSLSPIAPTKIFSLSPKI